MRITTMIIVILFSAHLLGYFVTFSKVTDQLLRWITTAGLSPNLVMVSVVLLPHRPRS
jgi:TRAP-type C4-dicarboxylate transport system permease large subunit